MLNQGVLVLNNGWTAIHVTNVKRAVGLVVEGLAKVVDDNYVTYNFDSWTQFSQHVDIHGNRFIHTPNLRILVPDVILLVGYHRTPPRSVKFNRRNIYIRDNNTCQYCGCRPAREELTIDHVLPRCLGGRSTWENVVLACQGCNAKKGSKLVRESGMKLMKEPRRPQWFSTLRASLRGPGRPVWAKFVDAAYWNVALEQD
ncbi:MAG: HNH endonuclease [Candidatus Sumerlaeia bacterium]|nr:HNH endonuclease [Candidatus Sumerlaeia bacterium]